MRYRKKPIVFEAIQFTYPPTKELLSWCLALRNWRKARHPSAIGEVDIVGLGDRSDGRTLYVATEGDWICKGGTGEFYPCKPDIFAATYESAD